MREVFVDTSAWCAIGDSGDRHHSAALAAQEAFIGQTSLVVTNYILDELYTLLLMNIGYDGTVEFKNNLDLLALSGIVKVIWISPDIADEAWNVFKQFNADKTWSFTDCVSYVVMRQRKIREAFVFDRHFRQMGFICLP